MAVFLEKVRVLSEKVAPSIFDDSMAFWLDFQGSGRPETTKSEKKHRWKSTVFLVVDKTLGERFFAISGSILRSVWRSGAHKKVRINPPILKRVLDVAGEGSGDPFVVDFGWISVYVGSVFGAF